jgi:hypothetical protein
MERGQNIDAAGGNVANKRIILASELGQPDQRGDDALDREFAENAQERAEHADLPPDEDSAFCETPLPQDLWLGTKGVTLERKLKRLTWFMTTPIGIVEQRTGWHRQTIHRYRIALSGFADDLILSSQMAANIDVALEQQTAANRQRQESGL